MPSAVKSLASPLADMCACVCHMSRRVVVAGCTGAPYTHMHTVRVCTRCARTLVLARGPLCACRDQLCIGYCYRLSWVMALARHPSVPVWATTRKGMALLPLCRPPPPYSFYPNSWLLPARGGHTSWRSRSAWRLVCQRAAVYAARVRSGLLRQSSLCHLLSTDNERGVRCHTL